jgi:mono/diheme cytochrome c family protein
MRIARLCRDLALTCAVLVGASAPALAQLDRAPRVATWREAREAGLWRFVEDASGATMDGARATWRSGAGPLGTVVVVTSLTCPLCLAFGPDIAALEARWRERGYGFVHVVVGGLDTPQDVRAHVDGLELRGLVLVDDTRAIEAAFDARTTTETFVVDARGTLRYRGALSDRVGLGYTKAEASANHLEDALTSLAAGEEPRVPATTAPGCLLEPREPAPSTAPVTYSRQIARLVQTNCAACHRAGGPAPFALEDHAAVARRSAMIAAVVDDQRMPPWHAAPHASGASPWANDRSLLPREREELRAWIAAGKPLGDPAEAPLARTFEQDGWTLGAPDLVLGLPEPIAVPASGVLRYQYVSVPTGLGRDRWVAGFEVRPSDTRVVHHVLVHALPATAFAGGRLRDPDAIDETLGFFAAWVPGAEPVRYPPGTARLLPAGSVLLFELHYTPNGRATSDQTTIGLYFADREPDYRPTRVVRTAGLSNRRLAVPPRAGDHAESAHGIFTRAARIEAFMPHMHLRGARFAFDLVEPSGTSAATGVPRRLLEVPRYDFEWQLRYELAEPLLVPAGAQLTATGWFDNSPDNPANPAPQELVRFGPDTDDEMMIGYVEYVLDGEDPATLPDEPLVVVIDAPTGEQIRALDAERDGVVERTQFKTRWHAAFDRLDRNRDGRVDAGELPLLARPR